MFLGPVKNPGRSELRKFGFIMGGMFILMFSVLLPLIWWYRPPIWPVIVAAVFSAWALIAPASLWPVFFIWSKIGGVLGWVNTRILLTIFYFLVVTPIGLLMRLVGKDPMRRRLDKTAETYRIPSKNPTPNHMESPF